ncbi:Uncharacterized protein DAT39_012567 [Clarias magur]|uniref:Uncharacterized protein n=1 Tax=Clarias magur TaxID=1594786 RepID=A0A8J4UEN6_CLAMG|nr:Uncharacterized protein DAT39_012567 [Clarias magur]
MIGSLKQDLSPLTEYRGFTPAEMLLHTHPACPEGSCKRLSSNLLLPSTSDSAPSDCRVSFVFYNDIIASTVQTRSKRESERMELWEMESSSRRGSLN